MINFFFLAQLTMNFCMSEQTQPLSNADFPRMLFEHLSSLYLS